jgi:hypothetical protein
VWSVCKVSTARLWRLVDQPAPLHRVALLLELVHGDVEL